MNNELKSVEDIDALLDSEFKLNTEDTSENIDETEENEDSQDLENEENLDENSNDDIENDDSNEEENNVTASKPSAEDKKEFAFGKIRKENSDLKNQLNQKNEESEFLTKLAAEYGYTDVKQFQEAYEKAKYEKEAKSKGLDPVLYAQLQESNKRIAELENRQKEADLMTKASNFKAAIDKAVADYNLGENEKNEIFNKLEEAGYSVDTLLGIPSPEILIKGVLADKIAEFSKQKQIDKLEKLDSLSDDKHNGGTTDNAISLDAIINEEMKQYKADNYFN